MELTKEQTQQILNDFAKSYQDALGFDYTVVMIKALTVFAQNNPGTVREIAAMVIDDPAMFTNLLTPAGVLEFKEMIDLVKVVLPGK